MTDELKRLVDEAVAYFTAAFVRGVPLTPMDAEGLKRALWIGDPEEIRREAHYLFAVVDYEEAQAGEAASESWAAA